MAHICFIAYCWHHQHLFPIRLLVCLSLCLLLLLPLLNPCVNQLTLHLFFVSFRTSTCAYPPDSTHAPLKDASPPRRSRLSELRTWQSFKQSLLPWLRLVPLIPAQPLATCQAEAGECFSERLSQGCRTWLRSCGFLWEQQGPDPQPSARAQGTLSGLIPATAWQRRTCGLPSAACGISALVGGLPA